jgi:hypothetical protein
MRAASSSKEVSWRACWLGMGALASALALSAASVAAHPLGNFSISHYSGITIDARTVDVRYALDLAEIPTFQEIQETGIVADATHPSVATYALRKAETAGPWSGGPRRATSSSRRGPAACRR